MGYFYQVSDNIKSELSKLTDLSDWYDYMGHLNLHESESLDIEDAWSLWQEATSRQEPPLSLLFVGELKPLEYEGGDPQVGYLSTDCIKSIYYIFETRDESFFKDLLEQTGFSSSPYMFLYSELKEFFFSCIENENAVLFLLS